MAKLKVHGEGDNEAIIISSGSAWTYQCSKGTWCGIDRIVSSEKIGTVIEDAMIHVELHDEADLAKINGPR
jgi:hypothetical protein